MCAYCEENYPGDGTGVWVEQEVFVEDNKAYLEIETDEWDNYYDEFKVVRKYIKFCPYCGRKLVKE